MESRGNNQAVTQVRDPVHGEIGLSQLEYDVLDEPALQRLREIAQLGEVRRVYPSATHTRFEHSLGVMHVAGRLANSIGLSNQRVTEVRLAGLLHDTGHGPFSHTSERVAGGSDFEHETRSLSIARDICSNYDVDTTYVCDQISGTGEPNVVSGVIDADRLDYLLRDSLLTGVDHGLVDIKSILRFGTVSEGTLAFDKKAIPSINSFLSARLRMRKVVYRYSTVRHFDTLLFYALRDLAEDVGLQQMLHMDDATAHTQMKQGENAFHDQIQTRNLHRTRATLGTDHLSRQELSALSTLGHDTIAAVVKDAVETTPEEDRVLVSRPYAPEAPSQTVIIDGETSQPLENHSIMPEYVVGDSWENTCLTLYGSFTNSSAQTTETIASALRSSLKLTDGDSLGVVSE